MFSLAFLSIGIGKSVPIVGDCFFLSCLFFSVLQLLHCAMHLVANVGKDSVQVLFAFFTLVRTYLIHVLLSQLFSNGKHKKFGDKEYKRGNGEVRNNTQTGRE